MRGARSALQSLEETKKHLSKRMAGTQGMHRREERKEVTLCTAPTRRGPLLAGEKARFCSEWTILQRGTFPGKRELMNQYREPVSA